MPIAGRVTGGVRPPSQRWSQRFWVIPASCAVASVVVAWATVRLDRLLGDVASAFLFPGPPSGARGFLGSVTGAMISFTGLVFSITVVALTLTSGQFSPRVLRQFLRDRTIQWSLGIFVATFLFSMTTVREVLDTAGPGAFVPRISVTVVFVLVLVSVAMFVRYIDHVVHMLQVSSIIVSIADETRALLDSRCPVEPPAEVGDLASSGSESSVAVPALRPGVITWVDEVALAERARRDDLTVVLAARVGDFVAEGATLLTLHGDNLPGDGARYATLVAQDTERTMDQDIAFGFRQLVDVAVKALSPSVNDPTTACQVVDALHDLMRRLVTRPLRAGRVADRDGTARLAVPGYGVDDLVDVALIEIWHFGSGSTQIPRRLATMLDDLHAVARPEHRSAVARWRDTVHGAL